MKSKISCFNSTIFLKNVKRFWPIWASYLVILLLVLPTTVKFSSNSGNFNINQWIIALISSLGVILSFGFSILIAMALYSYIYKAKSASMFHALPIRRETLFITNYLTGLAFMVIPNILVFILTWLIQTANGFTGGLPTLLEWLGAMTALNVFFYSFATICAMVTGHIVILPLLYIILNFASLIIELLLRLGSSIFIFGLQPDFIQHYELSPVVNIIMKGNRVYKNGFACWDYIFALLIVAVVFTGLSFYLYKRRHLEEASEVIAVKPLKPVFKYIFSLGCGLVLGAILYGCLFFDLRNLPQIKIAITVSALAGALVGYFAAEMMLKKSFKVFKNSYKGYIAVIAVILLTVLTLNYDVFGIEKKVPKASVVKEVHINTNIGEFTVKEDDARISKLINLHKAIIDNKDEIGSFNLNYDNESYIISFDYLLDDDDSMQRQYKLIYSKDSKVENLLNDIYNDKDFIMDYAAPIIGNNDYQVAEITVLRYDSWLSLDKSKYDDLYKAVKADIDSGAFTIDNSKPSSGQIEVRYVKNDRVYFAVYFISNDCTNILNALKNIT